MLKALHYSISNSQCTYLRCEYIAHGIAHHDQIKNDPENVEIEQDAQRDDSANFVIEDIF